MLKKNVEKHKEKHKEKVEKVKDKEIEKDNKSNTQTDEETSKMLDGLGVITNDSDDLSDIMAELGITAQLGKDISH